MLGESCGVTESTLVLTAVILVSSFTSDTTSLCDLEQVTLPLCALVSFTLIWDNSYLSNLPYASLPHVPDLQNWYNNNAYLTGLL